MYAKYYVMTFSILRRILTRYIAYIKEIEGTLLNLLGHL